MPTIRQTRDKFKELIERLNTTKTGLKAEIVATKHSIQTTTNVLNANLVEIIPSLAPETLDLLDRASATANTGRNFSTMVAGLRHTDVTLKDQLSTLQAAWTSPEENIRLRDTKSTQHKQTVETLRTIGQQIIEIEQAYRPIDKHNLLTRPTITIDNYKALQTLNRWNYIFDSGYRRAYETLKAYRPVYGSLAEDLNQQTALNAKKVALFETEALQSSELTSLTKSIDAMDELQTKINRTQAKIQGDKNILLIAQKTALQLTIENPAFSAALATELGPIEGKKVAVPALKIHTLERSLIGLEGHENGINGTLNKLEPHIPKLNKGVRHVPSKSIRIDLDQIDRAVKAQMASSGQLSVNATALRSSVNNYVPTHNDNFNFYLLQNYLLLDMLTRHSDHGYCHATVGVTQHSNPVTLDHVSGDFNALSLPDTGVISTPDIQSFNDVTSNIPDIAMPDVSVPAIEVSVPSFTVDVPNFTVDVPNFTVDVPSFQIDTSPSFSSPNCD